MAQDMWQACDNGDLVGIYEMREKLEEVYDKQIHGLANWRALIDDEIYQVARTQRKARVAEAEGKNNGSICFHTMPPSLQMQILERMYGRRWHSCERSIEGITWS